MGVGYPGGVATILVLLLASLALWYRSQGTVAVSSVATPKAEWFYWITILFSQTLGTALGDWVADSDRGGLGFGFEYGALIFGVGLVIVGALYLRSSVSRTAIIWAAFILTRPLGATLGDLLDKPIAQGGLEVSRLLASLILLIFMALCIMLLPQRPASPAQARA